MYVYMYVTRKQLSKLREARTIIQFKLIHDNKREHVLKLAKSCDGVYIE